MPAEVESEKVLVVGGLHHHYHRPAGYQPGRLLIHEECKGESRDDYVLPAKNAALDENRLELSPLKPTAFPLTFLTHRTSHSTSHPWRILPRMAQ